MPAQPSGLGGFSVWQNRLPTLAASVWSLDLEGIDLEDGASSSRTSTAISWFELSWVICHLVGDGVQRAWNGKSEHRTNCIGQHGLPTIHSGWT